jgi:hypothetical protein
MSLKSVNLQRLFKAIRANYLNKDAAQPDERFSGDVMRRIRNLHQKPGKDAFMQMLGAMAWKLAPASALMILICAYGLSNFELVPDWQVLQLMINSAEETVLFEFLA